MTNDATQEKIDAVLDAALDDLDDDDEDDTNDEDNQHKAQPSTTNASSKPVQGPMPLAATTDPSEMAMGIDEMMKQLMQGGASQEGQADEFLGKLLQEMQSQIGTELEELEKSSPKNKKAKPKTGDSNKKTGDSNKKNATQSTQTQEKSSKKQSGDNDVDQAIASLIEGMATQAKLDEPDLNGPATSNGSEDELLKSMMNQLGEGFGDDVNADALIDGMMEQLLSKELMYEPIKKVTEKFPDWLEENKGKLPEAEYEQYVSHSSC